MTSSRKWPTAPPTCGGASISIGDAPPASPATGALWWDSAGGQLYLWFTDANSSQWVIANNLPTGAGSFLPLTGGTLNGALTVNTSAATLLTLTSSGSSAALRLSCLSNSFSYSFNTGTTGFSIRDEANSATRLSIDLNGNTFTSGNFGAGIAPPNTQAKPVTGSGGGWLFGWGVTAANFAENLYYDGTNWRYWRNGPATDFATNNGTWVWQNAPSGTADANATMTTRMSLDGSGNLNLVGNLVVNNGGLPILLNGVGSTGNQVQFLAGYSLAFDSTLGRWNWWGNNKVVMTLDFGGNVELIGNLTVDGNAWKPGGGPWNATSDDRVKQDVATYAAGLDEVCALAPISFRYTGAGGTADDGKTYFGLSAQATRPVMPELVIELDVQHFDLDGAPIARADTMLEGQLGTNLAALPLALVNAVRALRDQVAALTDRVAVLEGAVG